MPGTLFVVATPIGNLEDLTFRASRVLRDADVVAAEDTRRTAKLLTHYGIRKPLVSLREHNERRESERLIARLQAGESVALVSDAGTPAIADPGARLVGLARAAGLPVVPIPGPSAVVTALSVSGLLADEFAFMGFPPASGPKRTEWFQRLARETRPVVFFEAPHRIRKTAESLRGVEFSKRPILVHRELTKIFEELVEQHNNAGGKALPEKGEYVIVVGPGGEAEMSPETEAKALRIMDSLVGHGDFEYQEALELAARSVGATGSLVKRADKKRRYSGK
ncbi:MAG: 16S rRNA (cytidine(1402)-2'-O)-methyltransferase [Vicinamibacterales bacterium]